jgi:hypothetical protein
MAFALIIISAFILILIAFLLLRNHLKNSEPQEMLLDKYGILISYLARESFTKIIKSKMHEVKIKNIKKGVVWTYTFSENRNKILSIEYNNYSGILGKHTRNWNFSDTESQESMLQIIEHDIQNLFTKIVSSPKNCMY